MAWQLHAAFQVKLQESTTIVPSLFFRKEYLAFEQNINPVLADKMSSEKSRDYMQARRVAKEYEALTRGLKKDMLSVPPTGSPEETKQVNNIITTEDGQLVIRVNGIKSEVIHDDMPTYSTLLSYLLRSYLRRLGVCTRSI